MAGKLSALVVAHNEEAQLADCLASLAFADELVVVLDKCTDGTKAIAERFTDRVLEGSWEIEGARRNAGRDACSGEWILEVDADERVSDALAREIRQAVAAHDDGYFLIPFDNYVGARLVRYGWGAAWGVSAAARLSRKDAKRWGLERVHPALRLTGPERRLTERMVHYVDRDISDMIRRLDRYTSAKARDLRANPDGVGFARNVRRIFSRFWKCYVGRKGYKEGKYGFLIALFAGLYPILSYLKATLEDE
ncbi:MAG: glycosyltransferase family 2 protein [Marivibrio sp.]|uniref:glycosyltransferase family 2 protein n=1 Tax=Marivibrio sp. TaxID=2039719 RepID=UPI0032EFA283